MLTGAVLGSAPTAVCQAPDSIASLRASDPEFQKFIAIEGGHFVAFMRPDAFLHELIRVVVPVTRSK